MAKTITDRDDQFDTWPTQYATHLDADVTAVNAGQIGCELWMKRILPFPLERAQRARGGRGRGMEVCEAAHRFDRVQLPCERHAHNLCGGGRVS